MRKQRRFITRRSLVQGLAFVISAAGLGLSFQNCAGAKFTNTASENTAFDTDGGTGDSGPEIVGTGVTTDGGGNSSAPCHDFVTLTVPVKVILIVDNSGSTATTDAKQSFRQKSIRQFISDVKTRTNFTYGFDYFSDDAKALINDGKTQNPTFATSAVLSTALDKFSKISADGHTNYHAALAMAQRAILDDADFQRSPAATNYAVLFMSDGMPVDSNNRPLNSPADDASLEADVKALIGVSPTHVALSTVYFNSATLEQVRKKPGLADAEAIPRLQNMAIAGGGQFANTLIQGVDNMDLKKVITLPSAICGGTN